jgi:hypothetical protein
MELLFNAHALYPFGQLVTAGYPDAKPIIKWDREEQRNPVSWYVYTEGANITGFSGYMSNAIEIESIIKSPDRWYSDKSTFGESVLCVLKGIHDINMAGNTQAFLYSETLNAEMHDIRHVLTEFSKTGGSNTNYDKSVAFYALNEDQAKAYIRVSTPTGSVTYYIDRWE